MEIVPIYDRSELIRRAIDNVSETLIEVMLIVVLVILLFLWHVAERAHPDHHHSGRRAHRVHPVPRAGHHGEHHVARRHRDRDRRAGRRGDRRGRADAQEARGGAARADRRATTTTVVIEAVKEVAPASFFALLVIAVSFLPVLTLEAQEGRLFKPLAYTKTLAMLVAAVLAITLDPALRCSSRACGASSSGRRGSAGLANAVLVGRIRSGGDASDQPRPHAAVRAGRAAGRCAGSGR